MTVLRSFFISRLIRWNLLGFEYNKTANKGKDGFGPNTTRVTFSEWEAKSYIFPILLCPIRVQSISRRSSVLRQWESFKTTTDTALKRIDFSLEIYGFLDLSRVIYKKIQSKYFWKFTPIYIILWKKLSAQYFGQKTVGLSNTKYLPYRT